MGCNMGDDVMYYVLGGEGDCAIDKGRHHLKKRDCVFCFNKTKDGRKMGV